jgi:hypothetical protein
MATSGHDRTNRGRERSMRAANGITRGAAPRFEWRRGTELHLPAASHRSLHHCADRGRSHWSRTETRAPSAHSLSPRLAVSPALLRFNPVTAPCIVATLAAVALISPLARAQAPRDPAPSSAEAAALGLRSIRAVRIGEAGAAGAATAAPVIDGNLDDPIWTTAPIATDFVRSRPHPGTIAHQRTEARIAYDEQALYVAVRMFDPDHKGVLAPFPRRDDETTSDWIFVEIDSRHDHRSGFSFGVNPRGVQVDGTWANDVVYDPAWNGVWQCAARIDSLGWTAEYRIPFSQLAMSDATVAGERVFGLNIYRYSPKGNEVSNWSPRLPTFNGVVSHFNELRGIDLAHAPSQLEVTPYVGVRTAHAPALTGDASSAALPRGSNAVAGADAKLALPAGFTLAATIHPDFGQVEADPSVVNLTSFETFFPEQRPFFIESADVFTFNGGTGIGLPLTTGDNSLASENPFYSRRIGRAPHVDAIPGDASVVDVPGSTTILGAAKLVGHTTNGWNAGVLDAQTGTERASIVDVGGGTRDIVAEPAAQFAVARATKDFRGGESAAGAMFTTTHRFLSANDSTGLPSTSIFGGIDGRHRFRNDDYEASGFFTASSVSGSASAIRDVENQSDHYMFRPDAPHLRGYVDDSARTSLDGVSMQGRLAKLGGGHWRWSAIGQAISPGFEVNDVGFQRNSDWLIALGALQFVQYRPDPIFRTWTLSVDQLGAGWSYGGERRAAVGTLNASGTFHNEWGAALNAGRQLSSLSTEALRGGPALLMPARTTWAATLSTDSRKRKLLTLTASGFVDDGGLGTGTTLGADFDSRFTDRLRIDLAPSLSYSNEGLQYVQHLDTASASNGYIVGRLEQKTASLTARVDFAFTPRATIQLYAQPLIGSASYGSFAEVVSPRARSIDDRIHTLDDASAITDPSFGTRDVLANAVFRWEYRPGSTLFVVFTQQRDAEVTDPTWRFGQATHELWRVPASSVLMVKWSYWWTP